MDVRAYLISQGHDAETASEIASNPKYAAIYEKAASEAEGGKTALLKAQEIEKTMKDWNATQVVPYVQKADKAVADAQAKIAAQSTYLKTLKDQGYDIPDAYLSDAPSSTAPVVPPPVAAKDYDKTIYDMNMAQLEIMEIAENARELLGRSIKPASEYKDFQQNQRPGENLRAYIDRKYDLPNLAKTRESERVAAHEKSIADAAVTAAKAEWAKANGTNGELRTPVNSRFDKVTEERKAGGEGGDKLWQTQAGRETARVQRLQKYAGRVN